MFRNMIRITDIGIEVNQAKFDTMVNHLVNDHGYTLANAQAEVRQELKALFQLKFQTSDIDLAPGVNIVVTFV